MECIENVCALLLCMAKRPICKDFFLRIIRRNEEAITKLVDSSGCFTLESIPHKYDYTIIFLVYGQISDGERTNCVDSHCFFFLVIIQFTKNPLKLQFWPIIFSWISHICCFFLMRQTIVTAEPTHGVDHYRALLCTVFSLQMFHSRFHIFSIGQIIKNSIFSAYACQICDATFFICLTHSGLMDSNYSIEHTQNTHQS